MRCGFTTGSCAAAAAKAAAYMLLTGKEKHCITIMTPKGIPYEAKIENIIRKENWVRCGVRKDGGDDPDITNGILICAAAACKEPAGPARIVIDGGIGVGRITKKGLDQPVGNAAINRMPRKMIEKEVDEVLTLADYKGTIWIEISIPEGASLAEKTFNPRLGITGGLSVLGTTGIVEPMSTRALLDTIQVELNVKKAAGFQNIAISPGNYGLDFMYRTYHFDLDQCVKCSNFIGETIDMAAAAGFRQVLLLGHIGKLIKVSGGILNTHSSVGDCRMELLAAAAIRAGTPENILMDLLPCAATEEALKILKDCGKQKQVMEQVMEKIMFYLNKRGAGRLEIECLIYSNEAGELARSKGAYALLKQWTESHQGKEKE